MMNTYFSQSLSFPRHKFSISNLILLLLLLPPPPPASAADVVPLKLYSCVRVHDVCIVLSVSVNGMEIHIIILNSKTRQVFGLKMIWSRNAWRYTEATYVCAPRNERISFLSDACLSCAGVAAFVIALFTADSNGYCVYSCRWYPFAIPAHSRSTRTYILKKATHSNEERELFGWASCEIVDWAQRCLMSSERRTRRRIKDTKIDLLSESGFTFICSLSAFLAWPNRVCASSKTEMRDDKCIRRMVK